jgi:hypothetical protein
MPRGLVDDDSKLLQEDTTDMSASLTCAFCLNQHVFLCHFMCSEHVTNPRPVSAATDVRTFRFFKRCNRTMGS